MLLCRFSSGLCQTRFVHFQVLGFLFIITSFEVVVFCVCFFILNTGSCIMSLDCDTFLSAYYVFKFLCCLSLAACLDSLFHIKRVLFVWLAVITFSSLGLQRGCIWLANGVIRALAALIIRVITQWLFFELHSPRWFMYFKYTNEQSVTKVKNSHQVFERKKRRREEEKKKKRQMNYQ